MPKQPHSPSVVELDGDFLHEYVHTRGIRLHVAVAGDPADPLVLFLHGWCGGWFEYKDVLAPLAQRGYRVAALDLRGFGMSDKPPAGAGQDIRTLTGDIAGVIQALGHDTAVIGGYETGAALAWAVAVDKPERVAGIISIAGIYPVDMRRSIAAQPWNFLWLIASAAWCRLPVRSIPLRFYDQDLDNNTTATFKQTAAYSAVRELRKKAAHIGNVARGALNNHRLLTAPMPLKWLDSKAHAPVLLLHAPLSLWKPVIRRARLRTTGPVTSMNIRGTKNMPHLETPGTFVDTLAAWLHNEGLEPRGSAPTAIE